MDAKQQKSLFLVCAAAVGVVLTASVFYPGVMSPDSVDQFRQARTGRISGDVFPPIMAFLWRYVDRVIPGPFGMVLVHNLAFWGGLSLVVGACRFGPVASVCWVLAIGLWPPVFALLGIVWKDVGMAAGLTLSVGLALTGARRRAPSLVAGALIPLWYALSVRLNAIPAILPIAGLICASGMAATDRVSFRPRTCAWLAVVVTSLLVAATGFVDRLIVTSALAGAPSPGLQGSMIHDLAGISVGTGQVLLPAYIRRTQPEITLERLRSGYRPADVNRLVSRRYWQDAQFFTRDKNDFDELRREWWRAIRAYPAAYLHHRLGVLETIFQVRGDVFYPFDRDIAPNEFGLTFLRRPPYTAVLSFLDATTGVFFRSWLFLVISAAVIWCGWQRRLWAPVAICSSGLLYVLPYTVVSSGSDFRFVWWLVVATLLGAILLISEWRPAWLQRAPSPSP